MRFRELGVKQKTATKNQNTALLLEFNIRVSNRNGVLNGTVQSLLEDAENGYSIYFRSAVNTVWKLYLELCRSIKEYDHYIEEVIRTTPECKKLTRLEGVGPINAINLYLTIGCSENRVFKTGKDVSACIGLTPVQHSSGGKTKLGSISKNVRNSILRSQLVTGAFTFVNRIATREAKAQKEQWVKSIIDRRGKKCAASMKIENTLRILSATLYNL